MCVCVCDGKWLSHWKLFDLELSFAVLVTLAYRYISVSHSHLVRPFARESLKDTFVNMLNVDLVLLGQFPYHLLSNAECNRGKL